MLTEPVRDVTELMANARLVECRMMTAARSAFCGVRRSMRLDGNHLVSMLEDHASQRNIITQVYTTHILCTRMTAILPPIPRFVFTVFEPISLVAGAVAPLISLPYFVTSQLGHIPAHPLYETEQVRRPHLHLMMLSTVQIDPDVYRSSPSSSAMPTCYSA